ncbi:MAG: DNA repair exonuclease [Actinobacteria bacterium]|nr:DNA repair exonuclease [Actinomycetota bacterium]
MIKICHIADVHLGITFERFGSNSGKIARQEIFRSFEDSLKRSHDLGVDLLLIAGDLFDDNFLPSSEIVIKAKRALAEFKKSVIICPGGHDCLKLGSVYQVKTDWSENVTIFSQDLHTISLNINGQEVSVTGRGNYYHSEDVSPLNEARSPGTDINIAIAHGSVPRGEKGGVDYPIDLNQISQSGFDYVALGHYHNHSIERSDNPCVVYAGSLNPLRFGQKGGGLVIAEISGKGKVNIEIIKIGRLNFLRLELASLDPLSELENFLKNIKCPEFHAVSIITNTLVSFEAKERIMNLIKDLESNFLFLSLEKIVEKKSEYKFPQGSLYSSLEDILAEELKGAETEEERKVIHEAFEQIVYKLGGHLSEN